MITLHWSYGSSYYGDNKEADFKIIHRDKLQTLICLINRELLRTEEIPITFVCGRYASCVLKEALMACGYSIRHSEKWNIVIDTSLELNIIKFNDVELTLIDASNIQFEFYSPFNNLDGIYRLSSILNEEIKNNNLKAALMLTETLQSKLKEIING